MKDGLQVRNRCPVFRWIRSERRQEFIQSVQYQQPVAHYPIVPRVPVQEHLTEMSIEDLLPLLLIQNPLVVRQVMRCELQSIVEDGRGLWVEQKHAVGKT